MKTYALDEDQLVAIRALSATLGNGSDKMRDCGHRLWLLGTQIEEQEVDSSTLMTPVKPMTLQRYLRIARDANRIAPRVPTITCKDGFTLSVQASGGHYCSPRNNFGPYTEVEVCATSDVPQGILDYHVDCDARYEFVPIEKVEALIALHGGADFSARW